MASIDMNHAVKAVESVIADGDYGKQQQVLNMLNDLGAQNLDGNARANLNRSYGLLTDAMGLNGYPQASSPSSGFSFTSPEQAQAAVNARVAELQGQVSSQQQAYIDQYNTKAKEINAQLASMGSDERVELLDKEGNPISESKANTNTSTNKNTNSNTNTNKNNNKNTNKNANNTNTNKNNNNNTNTNKKANNNTNKNASGTTKRTTGDVVAGVTGGAVGAMGLMSLNNESINGIISQINETVASIEAEWTAIVNNEIAKINSSWAALEAKSYVDKTMNAGNKIKSVEDGLKLLGSAYSKAIANSTSTQQDVMRSVGEII